MTLTYSVKGHVLIVYVKDTETEEMRPMSDDELERLEEEAVERWRRTRPEH